MCGIVGYTGRNDCIPFLLNGLERLEYRGYDSAGIAVISESQIKAVKAKGKLQFLKEKMKNEENRLSGCVGIGHTRWATHGEPSDENSHPHLSENGVFAVVHNGIIENYAELKTELIKDGTVFTSQTDTEVISQLLEKEYNGNVLETIKNVTDRLTGSYALAILCADSPDEIFCARNQSPLIVGVCDEGTFASSDVTAILEYTKKIYRIENGEFAVLKKDRAEFFSNELSSIDKEITEIKYDISSAEKCGYEHFMLKEIMEQPEVLRNTLSPRIKDNGEITPDDIVFSKEYLEKLEQIYIVACGSAFHVGVLGKYVIEKLTEIPVQVDIASEFRYRSPIINGNMLVIAVSQSGETADTLAAVRLAREKGARIMSIVNVVGSTLSGESDDVLYTRAGPEIAVATTKAYSSQLMAIYILAVNIAQTKGLLEEKEKRQLLSSLISLPDKAENILKNKDEVEKLSEIFEKCEHAYFIGRNIDYAASLEASLKMKEISYIHSEAYGAGELKHGTISLIENGTLVVAMCCCDGIFQKTLSNIKEVKARGARVLCVTTEKHKEEIDDADYKVIIPDIHPLLVGSLEVIPMQLLAYYTAKRRGCDIDKPKNLAKSVTVE